MPPYIPSPFPPPTMTVLAGTGPGAATPHCADGGNISTLVGAEPSLGNSCGRAAASDSRLFSPSVSGFPPFNSQIANVSGFPPFNSQIANVSGFPPFNSHAVGVSDFPLSFARVNFENSEILNSRDHPIHISDSPAIGSAARPITLDSPGPAARPIVVASPAPAGADAPETNLFKRLVRGIRVLRSTLDQNLRQDTGVTRSPIQYRDHESVAQLALDWAVSVHDEPDTLSDCLSSVARLTDTSIADVHHDLQRSRELAFTIISVFAHAICGGSPSSSQQYARRCLDVLEGDLLYQTNLFPATRRITSRHRESSSEHSNSDSSSSSSGSDDSDSSSTSSSNSSDKASKKKRRSLSKGSDSTSSNAAVPSAQPSGSTEQLLVALLNKPTSLVATPPSPWIAGDAPKGGYYLDTFVRVYRDYQRFVRIYGHTSVTFKSLIGDDMEPQIRADCNLSDSKYQRISDDDLLNLLKRRLSFKEKDYYLSQLEQLRLPPVSSSGAKLYTAFTKMSTDMLKIEDDALQNGVKLSTSSLKNIFTTFVKPHYRMRSWFHAKKFKSLSRSVRYINGKIKKRMVDEKERDHEYRMDHALANGVRQDHQGGKREDSDAPPRRGGFGSDRGSRGGRGRGDFRGGIHKRDSYKPPATGTPDKVAMDAAYAAEKALPKGRFWHKTTPFCYLGTDGKCQGRICQGCGFHSTRDNPGHERPRCRHHQHADFVPAPKYWSEVWPGRNDPIGIKPKDPKASPKAEAHPSAKANGAGGTSA